MDKVIWAVIMFPLAALFTGLGVFAWRREKPMWFWSGSEVDPRDITDVKAYNRANGIMWLAFSGVYWIAAFLGLAETTAAGWVVGLGTIAGIPVLIVAYGRIRKKYKRK